MKSLLKMLRFLTTDNVIVELWNLDKEVTYDQVFLSVDLDLSYLTYYITSRHLLYPQLVALQLSLKSASTLKELKVLRQQVKDLNIQFKRGREHV